MRFILSINCDTEAFHGTDCPNEEHQCVGQALQVADILRSVRKRIKAEGLSGFFETIYDTNGNSVGTYAIKRHDYINTGRSRS